jgi:hypothetical protein
MLCLALTVVNRGQNEQNKKIQSIFHSILFCSVVFYLYNNVVFSIYYAKIMARVENIVHGLKGSAPCLSFWPLFTTVNAKHNINIIIILNVYYVQ